MRARTVRQLYLETWPWSREGKEEVPPAALLDLSTSSRAEPNQNPARGGGPFLRDPLQEHKHSEEGRGGI